jgi:alanine racemase
MGMNHPHSYEWLREPGAKGVTLLLSTVESVEELSRTGAGTPFHIKIDTGMSRLGLRDRELDRLLGYLSDRADLPWSGLMTHFANVEDVSDQSFAQEQLARFQEAAAKAKRAAGRRDLTLHTAASAAALILPESRFDLCRIGISLYGLWPSRQTRLSALNQYGTIPELRPALTWKSRIVHLNSVPSDSSVGYGLTYRTTTDTRVAVIPTGYFEGYERALSNRSHVLIGGRRARLIGRVCMNMIMADVSHIEGVSVGDEVVLIGTQGGETVTADDLAELTHTINYEVVTRIQRDIPRIIVD